MAKAFQISVDYDGDEGGFEDDEGESAMRCTTDMDSAPAASNTDVVAVASISTSAVCRVKTTTSPYFFAFYFHHTCKILVDTGATSTLVSLSFVNRVNIPIRPTKHSAFQLDKSIVSVSGEVQFYISFGKRQLLVDGLVNESLDCDILAGCPFCEENYVDVSCSRQEIIIDDPRDGFHEVIKYGAKPKSIQHDIYRVSTVLRTDSQKVLLPGEYLEVDSPELKSYEGEVSVEPRADSPLDGQWPDCNITRVIQGTVRIPNLTNEPIPLKRSMHIAQVRRVSSPDLSIVQPQHTLLKPPTHCKPYSSTTTIDPSGKLLTKTERLKFAELHQDYDQRFCLKVVKVDLLKDTKSGRIENF